MKPLFHHLTRYLCPLILVLWAVLTYHGAILGCVWLLTKQAAAHQLTTPIVHGAMAYLLVHLAVPPYVLLRYLWARNEGQL